LAKTRIMRKINVFSNSKNHKYPTDYDPEADVQKFVEYS